MRGSRGMAALLWLLSAAQPVAGEPKLGKYLCVTDYAAGIILQSDGALAAGKIAVAPEKQKFFVTIRADLTRDFEYRRQHCFSKEQGEALKYRPAPSTDEEINKRVQEDMAQATKDSRREDADPNYKEPEAYYPGWFISSCLTNFDADVADHRSLVSLDGIVFADYSGFLEFIFQLDPKDAFRIYERDMAAVKPVEYNDTVYRGRCEFIQAAK